MLGLSLIPQFIKEEPSCSINLKPWSKAKAPVVVAFGYSP
jgi:hypothetical protein